MGWRAQTCKHLKGKSILPVAKLGSIFKWHFSQLREENFLVGCTDIASRLSYYLSEINVLHPFREGNGRAQRLFIEYLAENAGYHVNFSDVSSKEMIVASAEAFALNYEKMDALFKRITTENKSH